MRRGGNAIQVLPGQIQVNDVWAVASGRGHLILEADCTSKYPAAATVGAEGGAGPSVFLIATEETLRATGHPAATQIILPARTAGWPVMVDVDRYAVRIAAWRPVIRLEWLWACAAEQ